MYIGVRMYMSEEKTKENNLSTLNVQNEIKFTAALK